MMASVQFMMFGHSFAVPTVSYSMTLKKTATLNLRIDPALKEAIREAAFRDQRSVANMVEVLIRRHCEAEGIPIPEQQSLFREKDNEGE